MTPESDASERMRAAFEANAIDLLAYLERRIEPRTAAADVLGDAVEVAWKKVRALPREPEQARMWLFTVAKNTLANHRRGLGRHRAAVEKLREVLIVDQAAHGADDVDQAETRMIVQRALASLRPQDAELVRLVHWDGFALAEVAALESLPASTVRSRYAVVLRHLETVLTADSERTAPHDA
ncbi:RNA polymerase, sigma subunit, ECF family [Rathayibacter oskolensis]|uniref:RNA polymerase, sigma subunit, ECF family n=1 Tax=Rathayibacter oskolensis TaxID=1891671 RepID=A0A1X7PCR7_9MICO|nr:RNA polymerase sigma factor [Rathayibacter oskolensis]SMH49027.1 RNA polymerase, sigma subunit, ECF family [Rathayibacter oskolensis]